ncbi:MAG TPA: hypothetical protein PKH03_12140 [Syntrophales bacterium]|nr:hypothetical protein [Syntrophales bacterium]
MFKSPRPDQFHPERRIVPPVRRSPNGMGIAGLPVGHLLPAILFAAAFGGWLG